MHAAIPAHVTIKVMRGLWNLRNAKTFAMILRQIESTSGAQLRVTHFSVQHDHVHLIVEAESNRALSTGIQGLSVRIAHQLNRLMRRRGKVFKDRYHVRVLATPREVKNALVYLATNGRKHLLQIGRAVARGWLDPCASIAALGGWCPGLIARVSALAVVRPQSWLLSRGYSKAGCISLTAISNA
jgi:hypothetical protein